MPGPWLIPSPSTPTPPNLTRLWPSGHSSCCPVRADGTPYALNHAGAAPSRPERLQPHQPWTPRYQFEEPFIAAESRTGQASQQPPSMRPSPKHSGHTALAGWRRPLTRPSSKFRAWCQGRSQPRMRLSLDDPLRPSATAVSLPFANLTPPPSLPYTSGIQGIRRERGLTASHVVTRAIKDEPT